MRGRRRYLNETLALAVVFAATGAAYTSWVVRVPELRDAIGGTYAVFGWVLLAESIGAVIGTQLSRRVAARIGVRPTILGGVFIIYAGLVGVGVAGLVGSAPLLAFSLATLGLGFGLGDVALNIAGADVEQARGRSLLPALHGMFSIGCLAGSAAGSLAVISHVPPAMHLAAASALTAAATILVARCLPRQVLVRSHQSEGHPRGVSRRVVALILVALAAAAAEGAATGWLALAVVDGLGLSEQHAAVAMTVFLASATVIRLTGPLLVDRWGRAPVTAIAAVAGLVGVALFVTDTAYLAGAALWGLGVALGLPLSASAAADEEDSDRSVARVTAFGYVGYLVAPVVLGGVAQLVGPLVAVGGVVVPLVLTVLLAPALRRPATNAQEVP